MEFNVKRYCEYCELLTILCTTKRLGKKRKAVIIEKLHLLANGYIPTKINWR